MLTKESEEIREPRWGREICFFWQIIQSILCSFFFRRSVWIYLFFHSRIFSTFRAIVSCNCNCIQIDFDLLQSHTQYTYMQTHINLLLRNRRWCSMEVTSKYWLIFFSESVFLFHRFIFAMMFGNFWKKKQNKTQFCTSYIDKWGNDWIDSLMRRIGRVLKGVYVFFYLNWPWFSLPQMRHNNQIIIDLAIQLLSLFCSKFCLMIECSVKVCLSQNLLSPFFLFDPIWLALAKMKKTWSLS